MKEILLRLAEVSIPRNDVNLPKPDLTSVTITNGLKIVFGMAGAVAAIIITIAAFKYVVSLGDTSSTAKAKDAILYALIGLLVCATAFGIVTFVADRL
jgi:hypothetical protein